MHSLLYPQFVKNKLPTLPHQKNSSRLYFSEQQPKASAICLQLIEPIFKMACHLQPQRPETKRIFYRCSEPLRKAFSHCNVRLGALDLLGCLYRHDCQTKALQNTEELAQLVITTKTRGFSAGNMIHVYGILWPSITVWQRSIRLYYIGNQH